MESYAWIDSLDENRVYTYRFVYRLKDAPADKLNARLVSEIPAGLKCFCDQLMHEQDVLSCIAEYVCEFDFARVGLVECIKKEEKEENEAL